MPREKGAWSATTYGSTAKSILAGRESVTHLGEERARQGQGLDPLVDPRTHNASREALNLVVEKGGKLVLSYGVALPFKTALDTTGSMGGNVKIAFGVIPHNQELLVQNAQAILRRYHVQFATAVVQDKGDKFPHQHSEFEPDNEVEKQMRLLVPEKAGGDSTEDYQLDMWYTAERTKITIVKYGLRGYYFVVGDERGRDYLDPKVVSEVYGLGDVQKVAAEDLGQRVRENWHVFYLQVETNDYATRWWTEILGRERVVILPRTEDIAFVQAVIAGLTEGVLDLQNAQDFLTDIAEVEKSNARRIVQAVSHIPLRAQADLPNFANIPMAGAVFAKRDDIWPIGFEPEETSPKPASDGITGEIDWQL